MLQVKGSYRGQMQDGDHTDGHNITLFAEQLTRTFEVLVIFAQVIVRNEAFAKVFTVLISALSGVTNFLLYSVTQYQCAMISLLSTIFNKLLALVLLKNLTKTCRRRYRNFKQFKNILLRKIHGNQKRKMIPTELPA